MMEDRIASFNPIYILLMEVRIILALPKISIFLSGLLCLGVCPDFHDLFSLNDAPLQ